MLIRRKKSRNLADGVTDVIRYVLIFTVVFMCVYPFYYVIIYSISDPAQVAKGVFLWPRGFDLSTYQKLFQRDDLLMAFLVSISRTVLGTALTVFCTSFLAFLLTRKEMAGRKLVYRYVIITMYVSGGLIPWYLVMKAYHLDNNFLLYVLPGAINAYYMILIKTFMEQLPDSLEEAAIAEGAGFCDLFFRIVIPLSKPIIATVCVYCAVGQWNSWLDNFYLITDKNLRTVQYILQEYLNSANVIASAIKSGTYVSGVIQKITPESVKMTSVVITMAPVMLIYPFAQKYFTKGIMLGAVKG